MGEQTTSRRCHSDSPVLILGMPLKCRTFLFCSWHAVNSLQKIVVALIVVWSNCAFSTNNMEFIGTPNDGTPISKASHNIGVSLYHPNIIPINFTRNWRKRWRVCESCNIPKRNFRDLTFWKSFRGDIDEEGRGHLEFLLPKLGIAGRPEISISLVVQLKSSLISNTWKHVETAKPLRNQQGSFSAAARVQP